MFTIAQSGSFGVSIGIVEQRFLAKRRAGIEDDVAHWMERIRKDENRLRDVRRHTSRR